MAINLLPSTPGTVGNFHVPAGSQQPGGSGGRFTTIYFNNGTLYGNGQPIVGVHAVPEPDWNVYLSKTLLPPITLKYKVGGIYVCSDNFLSFVVKTPELNPNIPGHINSEILATSDSSWVEVGYRSHAPIKGSDPKRIAIIKDGENAPIRSVEEVYGTKAKTIDLNYYKHKCNKCGSPALIMFTSIDCSKCGEL